MESLDFDPQSSQLHVSGRIAEETKFTKVGQYHTLDLELQRNFTLTKDGDEAWDSVARGIIKESCDPVKSADVWAVVMQEGLANLALLTGARTVLRQRVEVSIPRKRGGRAGDHDKVLTKVCVIREDGRAKFWLGLREVLPDHTRHIATADRLE